MKKYIDKIRNSPFWRSVMALSTGQIIGQAITLFTTPIVSRLYSNEEYGEYGILISTATIIIGIIGLGLGSSIMVAKDDDAAQKIFRVIYALQVALAMFLCIGILAFSPIIQLYKTSINYSLSLLIIFAYIITNSLVSLLSVYINRLRLNKVLFFNPLIGAMCTLFITIPFGFLKLGFIGLMLAVITANTFSALHMLKYGNPLSGRLKFHHFSDVFRESKEFIFYQYPANLIGVVSTQLPNQTLSNFFGNAALGSYAMCNKLFNLPLHLLATPIQTIYFRTASEHNRENKNIAPLTYSLITKILIIAVVPMFTIILFGKQIFIFFLGNSWREAGELASILIIPFIFTFCNACIIYCRVSIGKQRWNLYSTIIQLVIILFSLYAGYAIEGTLNGVILFYSVFNTIWQIINIEITFICLKQYYIRWIVFSLSYATLGVICYILLLI